MTHRLIAGILGLSLLGLAHPISAQQPPDAVAPAPFGYKRDDRGRLMQTHFDLRRRYFAGVQWAGTLDGGDGELGSGTALQIGGIWEGYEEEDSRRTRLRYLEGRLRLQDLEIEGLLFEYARGRRSQKPLFWVTTFVGEPRRFDVALDIAPGVVLGRFWSGAVGQSQVVNLDVGHVHLDWELVQSGNLEDYFALRFATGLGVRFFPDEGGAVMYLYPEIGARWSWLIGGRGLAQWGFDSRARLAHEPTTGVTWTEARAATGFERILLAISDQPIALFAEPSLRYLALPVEEQVDLRLDVGVRLSLFAPPREPDDLCPDQVEDYDYDQDEDGCPE